MEKARDTTREGERGFPARGNQVGKGEKGERRGGRRRSLQAGGQARDAMGRRAAPGCRGSGAHNCFRRTSCDNTPTAPGRARVVAAQAQGCWGRQPAPRAHTELLSLQLLRPQTAGSLLARHEQLSAAS